MDFFQDIKALALHARHELLGAAPELLDVYGLAEVCTGERVILDSI